MTTLNAKPTADAKPTEVKAEADGTTRQERRYRQSLLRDSLLVVGVEGMHSHACEATIVDGLHAVEGVSEAEVDFPSGQASVIFDARRVTAHQLLRVIADAGYRCGDHFLGSGGGKVE